MQLLNTSPHVLQLLGVAALSHDRLGLVFPRYGQNLRDFALERQAGCQAGELERAFELEELAHCALCLACGLEHVHAHGLTRADVKPDNVLVTGKGLANVASEDFAEALRNIPHTSGNCRFRLGLTRRPCAQGAPQHGAHGSEQRAALHFTLQCAQN